MDKYHQMEIQWVDKHGDEIIFPLQFSEFVPKAHVICICGRVNQQITAQHVCNHSAAHQTCTIKPTQKYLRRAVLSIFTYIHLHSCIFIYIDEYFCIENYGGCDNV